MGHAAWNKSYDDGDDGDDDEYRNLFVCEIVNHAHCDCFFAT